MTDVRMLDRRCCPEGSCFWCDPEGHGRRLADRILAEVFGSLPPEKQP
jgi:hypothetical protein